MKRKQAFEEEGENDERRSRRLSQSSQSFDENFVVKKENTAADVNPSIYADYLKLDERYADLEMKYTEAMRQLAEFEQAKYEEEEFINRATEERDLAKKKADEAIAEKEDALKKMKDIEAVNKNLNDDIQEANEKIKQGSSDLEQQIASLQKELEDEKTKNAAAYREEDLSALKLQYDAMKEEYEIRMKDSPDFEAKYKAKKAELKLANQKLISLESMKDGPCDLCESNQKRLDKYVNKNRKKAAKIVELDAEIQELRGIVLQVETSKKQFDMAAEKHKLNQEKMERYMDLCKASLTEKEQAERANVACVKNAAIQLQRQAKIPDEGIVYLDRRNGTAHETDESFKLPIGINSEVTFSPDETVTSEFSFGETLPSSLLDLDELFGASTMQSSTGRGFKRASEYSILAYIWKNLSLDQQRYYKKPNSTAFLEKCYKSYSQFLNQEGHQSVTQFVNAYTKSTEKHKNALFLKCGLTYLLKK